ncbi:MAG: PH domain-containing protein [bacterium]
MKEFENYHFKDLDESDEILYVYHRNWFYLLQQYFFLILMLVVFVGAVLYFPLLFPDMLADNYRAATLFFENVVLLALWLFGFLIWVDYYFDVWVITAQRIVNIEQKGLFMRKVSELRYEKIQDVTTQVEGIIPTMLNFGDVKIQTAAEEGEFIFRTVSDPYHVKNIILELQRKQQDNDTAEIGEMIKEKIQGADD